jgi:tetratricopeptide (TPR) repeat protein
MRGHANEGLGGYSEAIADFTAALKEQPSNAHLLDCRGNNYLLLGRHDEAAADCRKSLEIQPEQVRPNRNLAWIAATGPAKFRDLPKALFFASRAVTVGGNQPWSHHCLGVVYYRLGRWQDAVKAFEKGLELRKGQTNAYFDFFLAMCQAKIGNTPRAREHYRRAVKWTEAQKNLPPTSVKELKRFRAEAELVLGLK